MEELIDQEMLVVSPVAGAFDVKEIAARIAATGFSFRDATEPSRFVISSDAASRDRFLARRRADPERGFPRTLMVDARPDAVLVWPVAGFAPLRALSEDFLAWLTTTHECRVESDDGEALPSRVEVAGEAG
jgi:hypothetical protein